MSGIDLTKQYEFFQPENDQTQISIIGCGSVGSTIVENLARCGITKIDLYDFDVVEPHNIVNQMFRLKDVGAPKVEALKDLCVEINPDLKNTINTYPKGWNGEMLSGYIFLAVDSIELRKKIVEQHYHNPFVKAVFDVRTGLMDAESRCAVWSDRKQKKILLDSMQFTDAEANASNPVSACGTTLGVVTTVRLISSMCVNNYIKLAKGEEHWKYIEIDGFKGELLCFN